MPYGVRTDASGLIMAQFFGAALLQLALVFLFHPRHSRDLIPAFPGRLHR
jgi:hypothetical protein